MILNVFKFFTFVWLYVGLFIGRTVSDEVKDVIVMEGKNITLHPQEEKEGESLSRVTWLFQSGSEMRMRISHWNRGHSPVIKNRPIGSLSLDQTSGALTIWNISSSDAGLYTLSRYYGDIIWEETFRVDVYEAVSAPVLQAELNQTGAPECRVTCSVSSGRHVNISWSRGGRVMESSISSFSLTLVLQDSEIYSCTAANPVSSRSVSLQPALFCPQHHERESASPLRFWCDWFCLD